jgi:hypothetical protein
MEIIINRMFIIVKEILRRDGHALTRHRTDGALVRADHTGDAGGAGRRCLATIAGFYISNRAGA